MRHLLHTVILGLHKSLNRFIETLIWQRKAADAGSRLAFPYAKYVRRVWATECHPPLVDRAIEYQAHYNLLYEIFRGAHTLGFNEKGLHLLYEVLDTQRCVDAGSGLPGWKCTRLVFAGETPIRRCRQFTQPANGLALLRRITHLTMWFPDDTEDGSSTPESTGYEEIPKWVDGNFAVPLSSIYRRVSENKKVGKNGSKTDILEWERSNRREFHKSKTRIYINTERDHKARRMEWASTIASVDRILLPERRANGKITDACWATKCYEWQDLPT
ncbi:hypothetical protein CPC08DRAFT_747332 [Agrocybe pediades]|nr:hypothetical protein CPC08DRAFT_747332 [Agrocybe pediades]